LLHLVLPYNFSSLLPPRLLRTLFPLLSILTSAPLRSSIRKTILTDIRTANAKTKNHKLNRMVQALLFGMVERGMGGDVEGSRVKGKGKKHEDQDAKGGEAMWAVVLVKELWRKGIWNDPKTVAIVALACNHPNTKVQSAAIHFFLGSENEDEEDSDEEEAVSCHFHLAFSLPLLHRDSPDSFPFLLFPLLFLCFLPLAP
jgi:protein SDA1